MSEASLEQLLFLFTTGLGLFLVGASNFLLARQSRLIRFSAGGSAVLLCSLSPFAVALPHISQYTFLAIVGSLAIVAGFSSIRTGSWMAKVWSRLRLGGGQAAMLVALGSLLMGGGLARYSAEEDAAFDLDASYLEAITARPPLSIVDEDVAETDLGSPIELHAPTTPRDHAAIEASENSTLAGMGYSHRLIRVLPASDYSNCHGWVLTGGKYWLSPDAVEKVLVENGYTTVSDPRPGDLVIYRQNNQITHTAIVHSVDDGEVFVKGKWGWMGVYVHRIADAPYGYDRTFHRSAREGHVLRGLSSPEGIDTEPRP